MDDIGLLNETDKEDLKSAFNKYDKRKTGSILPREIADVMRMAGQNPTNDDAEKMVMEAEASGTGMLMFSDLLPIAEKYWKNPALYNSELRDACLAFDRQDTGTMDFEEIKAALLKYGEPLEEDDLDLMQKVFNAGDGKIIVDEFIKVLATKDVEAKKGGKKGKGGKTSAKKGKK